MIYVYLPIPTLKLSCRLLIFLFHTKLFLGFVFKNLFELIFCIYIFLSIIFFLSLNHNFLNCKTAENEFKGSFISMYPQKDILEVLIHLYIKLTSVKFTKILILYTFIIEIKIEEGQYPYKIFYIL